LVTTETNAEGLATYSYDDTNQLTGVDRPTGQTDESYGYDLNGNRNTTGYTTTTGNRMTASPGYTYTYDAEGNTTAKTETATGKVTTYAYDHRNRMTGATQKNSGGTVIMQATYVYDALGRRIKTDVDADGAGSGTATVTWYAYDGDNTYADFSSGGTLLTRYLYGLAIDFLLSRTISGGTTSWYLTDRLGTVRDIANTSGSVIDHMSYDAFGQILTESSPSDGDRFAFTGRERGDEAGSYYYRARTFSGRVGRFLQSDPSGLSAGDANLYRYVNNTPINGTDPSGRFSWIHFGLGALEVAAGTMMMGEACALAATGTPVGIAVSVPLVATGYDNFATGWRQMFSDTVEHTTLYNAVWSITNSEQAAYWAEFAWNTSLTAGAGAVKMQMQKRMTDAADEMLRAHAAQNARLASEMTEHSTAMARQARSAQQALELGMVRPDGRLFQVLKGIESEVAASQPRSALEAMKAVASAAERMHLEPGHLIPKLSTLPNGPIVLSQAGGITTTLLPNGGITIVDRLGEVLLHIPGLP
jgi:RHS repeat-associated protein